jgi:hypothetical protein
VSEAVEGFHVAAVLAGLDDLGVLDALTAPRTARAVANALHVDSELLRLCLELLAGRTDVIDAAGGRYVVTPAWDAHAKATIRQYVRAYGAPSLQLPWVLGDPRAGADLVDLPAHARSYAGAPTVASLVADVVLQLDLVPTLDLGCGPASLLVGLARRHEGFVGWGVDANAEMGAEARRTADAEGFGDRITILDGDVLDPAAVYSAVGAGVRSITAVSLLNGLWGSAPSGATVTRWLASLADAFPGRALIVADYFGRLGHVPPPWPPGVAVHDLVQALTGQGVPPPDHDAWRAAYDRAGVRLLHMIEDERSTFFIDVLHLPGHGTRT